MPLIRTTMNPNVEVFVTEEEYLDLLRQGLVFEGPARPPVALNVKTRPEQIGTTGDYRLIIEGP